MPAILHYLRIEKERERAVRSPFLALGLVPERVCWQVRVVLRALALKQTQGWSALYQGHCQSLWRAVRAPRRLPHAALCHGPQHPPGHGQPQHT